MAASSAAARTRISPTRRRATRCCRARPRRCKRKLGRLIRGVDTTVEFAWTGSFGSSATGLPTIGRIPRMPCCWAALGYGGNGTTYSRIAADVISGALTGRPDADADLYDF